MSHRQGPVLPKQITKRKKKKVVAVSKSKQHHVVTPPPHKHKTAPSLNESLSDVLFSDFDEEEENEKLANLQKVISSQEKQIELLKRELTLQTQLEEEAMENNKRMTDEITRLTLEQQTLQEKLLSLQKNQPCFAPLFKRIHSDLMRLKMEQKKLKIDTVQSMASINQTIGNSIQEVNSTERPIEECSISSSVKAEYQERIRVLEFRNEELSRVIDEKQIEVDQLTEENLRLQMEMKTEIKMLKLENTKIHQSHAKQTEALTISFERRVAEAEKNYSGQIAVLKKEIEAQVTSIQEKDSLIEEMEDRSNSLLLKLQATKAELDILRKEARLEADVKRREMNVLEDRVKVLEAQQTNLETSEDIPEISSSSEKVDKGQSIEQTNLTLIESHSIQAESLTMKEDSSATSSPRTPESKTQKPKQPSTGTPKRRRDTEEAPTPQQEVEPEAKRVRREEDIRRMETNVQRQPPSTPGTGKPRVTAIKQGLIVGTIPPKQQLFEADPFASITGLLSTHFLPQYLRINQSTTSADESLGTVEALLMTASLPLHAVGYSQSLAESVEQVVQRGGTVLLNAFGSVNQTQNRKFFEQINQQAQDPTNLQPDTIVTNLLSGVHGQVQDIQFKSKALVHVGDKEYVVYLLRGRNCGAVLVVKGHDSKGKYVLLTSPNVLITPDPDSNIFLLNCFAMV